MHELRSSAVQRGRQQQKRSNCRVAHHQTRFLPCLLQELAHRGGHRPLPLLLRVHPPATPLLGLVHRGRFTGKVLRQTISRLPAYDASTVKRRSMQFFLQCGHVIPTEYGSCTFTAGASCHNYSIELTPADRGHPHEVTVNRACMCA